MFRNSERARTRRDVGTLLARAGGGDADAVPASRLGGRAWVPGTGRCGPLSRLLSGPQPALAQRFSVGDTRRQSGTVTGGWRRPGACHRATRERARVPDRPFHAVRSELRHVTVSIRFSTVSGRRRADSGCVLRGSHTRHRERCGSLWKMSALPKRAAGRAGWPAAFSPPQERDFAELSRSRHLGSFPSLVGGRWPWK